jgi:hypothetical protein
MPKSQMPKPRNRGVLIRLLLVVVGKCLLFDNLAVGKCLLFDNLAVDTFQVSRKVAVDKCLLLRNLVVLQGTQVQFSDIQHQDFLYNEE